MANPNPPTLHLKATQFKPGHSGNPAGFPAEDRKRKLLSRPKRTVSECKEAAIRFLDNALWTYENEAKDEGVSEYVVQMVLKLLQGFNAALPKNAETPSKPVEEMTEAECRAALGQKK